jgi:hypothetical protein
MSLSRRIERLEAITRAAELERLNADADALIARIGDDPELMAAVAEANALTDVSRATPPEDWQANPLMVALIERERATYELPDDLPPWLWLYRWECVAATPRGRALEERIMAILEAV